MKKIFILLLILVSVSFFSCKRGLQKFERGFQATNRTYHIEQYSGGLLIEIYDFEGILNNSENSDGYYFFKNDTLIEVSGDLIIKSVN